jgi:hypothetical protein
MYAANHVFLLAYLSIFSIEIVFGAVDAMQPEGARLEGSLLKYRDCHSRIDISVCITLRMDRSTFKPNNKFIPVT